MCDRANVSTPRSFAQSLTCHAPLQVRLAESHPSAYLYKSQVLKLRDESLELAEGSMLSGDSTNGADLDIKLAARHGAGPQAAWACVEFCDSSSAKHTHLTNLGK